MRWLHQILQIKNLHGNVKESLNDFFLFKKLSTFFKKYIPNGMFLSNWCLWVLDGHGSHGGLNVIEHAIEHEQEFGLDMSTLPSHTSHVLLPFNVSCFKPLKITFKTQQSRMQLNVEKQSHGVK